VGTYISPEAARIRKRLQDGEHLSVRDAARLEPTIKPMTLRMTMQRWHDAFQLHIVAWQKPAHGGLPGAVYAWGDGTDAELPMTASHRRRLRRRAELREAKDAEKAAQHCGDLGVAREVWHNLHHIDPVLSALLGVRA
jgi:hypothetical protein